jgi:peptide/nickel transport system substrate-binding protein
MQAVVATIRARGIAEGDVRTDGIALYPVHDQGSSRISGYEASNRVRVTVHDVRRVGEALDAAVGAGANQAGEVRFAFRDEAPLRRQALDQAVKAARSTAEAIAASAAEATKPAEAAKPAAAPAPPKGGELKIGAYRTLDNLDPAVYWGPVETMVTQMLFDPLMHKGNDNKYHPGLAESWQVSDDGKTLTFKLRRGVKFHDGTDLKADAVKFQFDRAVDPATKSKYAKSLLGPYDSTIAVDDYTVQLRLKEPFAPIFDSLSQGYLGIPSPTAVKKYGDKFEEYLVGSGPFKLVEWKRDTHITLERNPEYAWGTAFPARTNAGPPTWSG